jgi:two-component system, cell cycle sensor histidine kinase and response regulator CckA
MKPLNALIVEDSKDDAALLLRHLSSEGYSVQSKIVQSAADMKAALAERNWDIVLSDYTMPHFTGLDALSVLRKSDREIPIIIISGTIGEDIAVEAMLKGANDYLMKGNLTRLAPAIERDLKNAAARRKQRQAEESLRRSEENLANAQRITHIGSWETDLVNNQLFWSDEVYRIFGVARDDFEVTLESFFNFIHPEDRQLVEGAGGYAVAQNASYNIEHRIVRPDGEIRVVREIGEVTFDETDRPIRFIGTVQDITDRKLQERLLLESEEKFRSIVETTTEWIWAFDAQGNFSYSNPSLETILGYVPEEILGKSFLPLMHEDDGAKVRQSMPTLIAEGRGWTNLVCRWYHKDGSIRYLESNAVPIFNADGGVIGFRGADRDITERERAESALRESESRLRTILETEPECVKILGLKGELLEMNRAGLVMLEADSIDQVRGAQVVNIVAPEHRQAFAKLTKNVLVGGAENLEFEVIGLKGSRRWLETHAVPMRNQAGEITSLLGVTRDITERKRAEAEKAQLAVKIERQHERLNNILANVPGVVWEAWGKPDAATQRIDFVSDYVETMLGYTVEEWVSTPNFWLSIVHPEDKERIAREATERFVTGEGYTRQFRWIAKDGHTVWVESQATVIRDESCQPIGLRGINIDITERRRLEEERSRLIAALDFEKVRLQHIFDNSPSFIVAMRGPDFIFERVNPAYYKLVGQRNLLGLPVREALPELVDQGFIEILKRVYGTGEPFIGSETAVKLQSSDGNRLEQAYINFIYTPTREADGTISGILSFGVDVTEQVLSRIKIQESEERYRFLFENNPLPMWVFDVETLAFLSVNKAAITHYGYSRDEFLTMAVKDIRPPEDIPAFLENMAIDIPGIMKAGVRRHIKKDRTVIEVEMTTNQLIFNGKKAKLVLANDVTERRKAEESIRFQAHLLDTVEQSVIATDLNGVVTYWNQFAEKLYGWTAAEAIGRFVMDLTTPEINTEEANRIMARLAAGRSWAGEFVVQNKAGAKFPAYVSNSPVNDNNGKIVGFVGVSVDITDRKNAETALRQAEDKYRSLVESSPAVVYLAEPLPPYSPIYVSPNIAKFGYTAEEWFSRDDFWVNLIHPEDKEGVLRLTETALRQGLDTDLEYRIIAADGTIRWLQDRGRFVSDDQGNRTGWQGIILDITKTKELEDQLRQAQKLESVGLLAGGIAHDFNNMLTAINGYSELTLRKMEASDPLRRNIEEIRKAGQRSADLTHQLLAFSRKQILQPIILDLNETIRDTTTMLDRLIGEHIQLTTTLNPKIGLVKVDQGQLSQIIMNLAVNARDAMPHGGRLTIETANVFLGPDYARENIGVLPGPYVMLAVSDSGNGMSAEVKEHIFEPFFTTKEVGDGTGLGLATVYGIIKQSGGTIEVYSEESIGSTFTIYLPCVGERAEKAKIKDKTPALSKGTESILLVEDEEMVRHLTLQILEECGYAVTEARNGVEALQICKEKDYKFDLLMTDVVMPELGGSELSEILKTKSSELKILFTSGYTDDAVIRHGVIEARTNFIQKPFTPEALADKIREILDNSHKT